MTSELKPELKTVGELFADGTSYIVPIYQRNYAWEDTQIEQLIRDVEDARSENRAEYFLGNLIVMKKEDGFEVVDGQQRLTTLYLLLNHLSKSNVHEGKLRYQARQRASSALQHLGHLSDISGKEDDGIHAGGRIISQYVASKKIGKAQFVAYLLERVKLVRVSLPVNTDLNRYFEVMNTRGQQLQPTDIVKARLMSHLADAKDRACFAAIWDACADMDSYVQMTLTRGDTKKRSAIFGDDWSFLKPDSFDSLIQNYEISEGAAINEIESDSRDLDATITFYANSSSSEDKEDVENERFESIIGFSDFLLHALKIEIGDKDEVGGLDDEKLIGRFDVIKDQNSVKKFAFHLLKTRNLFDAFVIKREYTSQTGEDGDWSLKRLKKQTSGSKSSPSYINTLGSDDNDDGIKDVILLESMLRVTYTAPREMHWITELVKWAEKQDQKLEDVLLRFSREKVRAAFCKEPQPIYPDIERIVFNYLDYILVNKSSNFRFTFRNSVEHFYPQNPDGEQSGIRVSEENLHLLGNLALVSVKENSKFSNSLPEVKAKTYPSAVSNSPKLKKMADICSSSNGWGDEQVQAHHHEMMSLLQGDIYTT